jgi:hypothetical protein
LAPSIKDALGNTLTDRTYLQFDEFDVVDEAASDTTVVRVYARLPSCAVRARITANLSGAATFVQVANPTPSDVGQYSGSVIRNLSLTQGGVTLGRWDRVLLAGQTTYSENGVWQVGEVFGGSCNLYKLPTLDALRDASNGVTVFVREGTSAGLTYQWRSSAIAATARRQRDYFRLDIDDFYLDADGANYDNAWKRVQQACEDFGEVTFLRNKIYNFAAPLEITKGTLTLTGAGYARGLGAATRLQFTNTHGIRLPFQGLQAGAADGRFVDPNNPTGRLGFARIRGFTIWHTGSVTQSNDFHGIECRGGASVEDCYVFNFPGNGIDVRATVQGGQSQVTVTCTFNASFAGASIGQLKIRVPGTTDQPEVIWTNTAEVPAGAGTPSVSFRPDYFYGGPYTAPAGTLTQLHNPPTGWVSATNAGAATPGTYPSGCNVTTFKSVGFTSIGKWAVKVDGSDTNAIVFSQLHAGNVGLRDLQGTRTERNIQLTSSGTNIGSIAIGAVTVYDTRYGLKYTNIEGGTLGPNSNITLRFRAVKGGRAYNNPDNSTLTILDIDATTHSPTTGLTLVGTGAILVSGTDNDGGGYWDSSLIGNTWIQCQVQTNLGHGYRADQSSSSSTFVGCYEELAESSAVYAPHVAIGGSLTNGPGVPRQPGVLKSTAGFELSRAVGRALGPSGVELNITKNNTDQAFQFYRTGEPSGYQLQWFPSSAGPLTNTWALTKAGSGSQAPLAFTDAAHSRGVAMPLLNIGAVIGDVKFHADTVNGPPATSTTSTGIPDRRAGIYNVGDRFWDDRVMWRCSAKDGSNNLTWLRVSDCEVVRGSVLSNISSLASFPVAQTDVTYVQGNRVLLVGQVTKSQNGIYTVGAVTGGNAPLTRATDFDASGHLVQGLQVPVAEGWGRGVWHLTTSGPFSLGTTDLDFLQIGAHAVETISDLVVPVLPQIVSTSVTTTNATVTAVGTVAMVDNSLYVIDVDAAARDTGGNVFVKRSSHDFKRVGGTATAVGSESVVKTADEITSLGGVSFTPSGNNVIVNVTGKAGTNIRWHVRVWFKRMSLPAAI